MRRVALVIAAAAASACAASPGSVIADAEDEGVPECLAETSEAFGSMAFRAELNLPAGTVYHSATWTPARRTRPASVREVRFHWGTPPAEDDGAHATIALTSSRWFEGPARLVLMRQDGPPIELETFRRRGTEIVSRGARRYEQVLPLATLRGAIGGAGRARLALVGEDGAVLVHGWIEEASLAQAEQALAAMRPAIASLLADPARNCAPPQPIVVWGS